MSERLHTLREDIRTFVDERNWGQYHDPKNLTMALASEVGELLDLFRWLSNDEADDVQDDPETMQQVRREIGDVTLCLLMLCDRLDIDPLDAAENKLEINHRQYPADEVRAAPNDADASRD